MSNFLDGVFTPRYTWSSVAGFETRLDTSLAGNTTIGDSTTNYSLLLNGLPIISGSDISSWSLYPAVSQVNLSLHDLSGIASFNGVGARFNSNSNLVAIGNGAASGNTGSYVNAFGCNAGKSNTGPYVNAFGCNAGKSNTGPNVNAFGNNAATGNTGSNVDAIGHGAAFGNSGSAVLAIGINAAYGNSGNYVNAIGYSAGESNTGNNCTFIGKMPIGAAFNTLSDRLIVYSSDANNPLLYGDTSNMSLGIGTSTLTSAALTVSGKISATGILDTVNSPGTANQVLTAGTGGGGLVWANNYPYIWQFNAGTSFINSGANIQWLLVPDYSNNNVNMNSVSASFQTIKLTGFYQINVVPNIGNSLVSNWQLSVQKNGNTLANGSYAAFCVGSTITGCFYLQSNDDINVNYSVGADQLTCSNAIITYILLSP
jgi:hypothetical protein